MKARNHVRSFQFCRTLGSHLTAILHRLDHAIEPLGTVSLILGSIAAFLKISILSNYLLAAGLLFHLTVWFADWLGLKRRE